MTVAASQLGGYALVIAISLLAAIGVTAVFSLAIAGAVRSGEARADRRRGSAAAWAAVSLLALVGVGVAIGLGLRILAG